MSKQFEIVGIRHLPDNLPRQKEKWHSGKPLSSVIILGVIVIGCLCAGWITAKNPSYLDLQHYSMPPDKEFLFGTDTMGRDIFSMIWHGGRRSLFIGAVSTLISTVIAVIFGAVSGSAPAWLDGLLMRLTEIILSVPSLLLVIFLQAFLGKANVFTISIVIGVTGWMSIAKVVRTEVRQIRSSEFVLASKCMGGGFFHVLWRHLTPNFVAPIMFMVVMNVRSAIAAESTLSFMGIGLPVEVITWGSMLSLAEKALLTGSWWIILIPGLFLIVTLTCLTNIGNYLRRSGNRRCRTL